MLPIFPRLSLDFIIMNVQEPAVLVGSRVVVGRHLALSRVEPELLEEAGDDQEHPVLGENLKVESLCFMPVNENKAETWLDST